mmetsp:Transcript_24436/g.59289  ORF Transcript_24436/g.59289 Transcript_24436/m.59289 type:complete len:301 (+) Transcript_24436:361-1263(+)
MLHAVSLEPEALASVLACPHEGPVVRLEANTPRRAVHPRCPHLPQGRAVHREDLAGVAVRGLRGEKRVVARLDRQLLLVHVVKHKRLPRVDRPLLRHHTLLLGLRRPKVGAVSRPEHSGAVLGVLDDPLLPVVHAVLLRDPEVLVKLSADVVPVVPPDRHLAVGVLLDSEELVGKALGSHDEPIARVPVDGEVGTMSRLEGKLVANALHVPLLPALGVTGKGDLPAVGRADGNIGAVGTLEGNEGRELDVARLAEVDLARTLGVTVHLLLLGVVGPRDGDECQNQHARNARARHDECGGL